MRIFNLFEWEIINISFSKSYFYSKYTLTHFFLPLSSPPPPSSPPLPSLTSDINLTILFFNHFYLNKLQFNLTVIKFHPLPPPPLLQLLNLSFFFFFCCSLLVFPLSSSLTLFSQFFNSLL